MLVAVTSYAHPKALTELLELVRVRVRADSLGGYVLNDPGGACYEAALARVLRGGAAAIEPDFDLLESLGPGVNWRHAEDDELRWFRMLTSCISLVLRGCGLVFPPHLALATLLVDYFALADSQSHGHREVGAALGRLCEEFPPLLPDPREGAFFVLGGVLLMADSAGSDAVADGISALERVEAQCEDYYSSGESWEPNPWFDASGLLLWGWVDDTRLHPEWFVLVDERFPRSDRTARAYAQRLLDAGSKWRRGRLRLG